MNYTIKYLTADGVVGYRICPPIQIIGDYAFLRWAWEPTLKSEEIIDEVAGYMNHGEKGTDNIANAIRLLEEFWNSCDLHKLDECCCILGDLPSNSIPDLMNLRDGIEILRIVARTAFETRPHSKKRGLAVQKIGYMMGEMPIYKGYTTSELWEGRIWEFLKLKSGWWMEFIHSLRDDRNA
jgi:hypothetical protein